MIERIQSKVLRQIRKRARRGVPLQEQTTYVERGSNWYEPLLAGPSTLVDECRSSETIAEVVKVLRLLTADPFVEFNLAYYQAGLDRFGAWCGGSCPNIPDARLQRITANLLGRYHGLRAELAVSRTNLEFAAAPDVLPADQTFEIRNTGSGVLGWRTRVTGGNWLRVTPEGAAPAAATVTVNPAGLPAGLHRATIRVEAMLSANAVNSPQLIEVSLRVSPPAVNAGGIVNGASLASAAPLSPGSLVSLFGTGLSRATAMASSAPLPTTLGGTEVLVNGIPVPLFFVSPRQINFQMPWEIAGETAAIVVRATGLTSAVTRLLTADG